MGAQLFKSGLLAGFVLVASSQISAALDADDFAKKLTQSYASSGATLSYSGVTTNGDNITLENAAVSLAGEASDLPLGNLVFEGVTEDGTGGYTVASTSQNELAFGNADFKATIKDIKVENMYVPADTTMASLDTMLWYDRITTGPISLAIEGQDVVDIARMDSRNTKNSTGDRVDMDARIDGLEINLTAIDDPEARQVLTGMGYQNLSGDMVINGYWQVSNGELTLSEYALTLDDVGRLDMAFSFSGYTLDFVKGLQQLQENMAGKESDAKAQQAMGMAMLGMLQQLSFNNLSLRFDDASVTNKILDMAASQQGISRQQMVQGLQAMVPFALAQLQNPEFQKTVTEAVSLYLSNPKNFEISAAPASPVPFATLFGSAMAAPQSLPNILGVTVTANQ